MSSDITRFERIINKINITYGLQIPVSILTFFAILLWIFKPTYFQPGALPAYIAMIAIVTLVSIIHSRKSEEHSKAVLAMIYACYHFALIIFTVAVAPFLTPFDLLWIVLAIGVDLLFGRKVMLKTYAIYAAALIAAFIKTGQEISFALIVEALVQYAGVVFISLQVSKYRRVSDDERKALDTTTRQSSFERQRLMSLINNMGEAVMATDHKGKILIYNAAMLSLFDTNKSLEGKSIDNIAKLKDDKQKSIKIMRLIKDNPSGLTSTDLSHYFSKDDVISLYINIAPVRLGFKQQSENGYIIIMRDITREKSLEEERDEFISVVSHELRTPVAVAEGNISNALFLQDNGKSTKKQLKDSLAQAHKQVVFLSNMINDLATLSRAERTDVELEVSEINPGELLLELGEDYRQSAETKGLKYTIAAASEVKPIHTSELYLREVIQNFATNAIKYTKKGSVVLHVRSDKKGNAIFSVSDTGIGLSKADQKRVLDKFFRSEDYRTRESSGTGLGLYVTSKLISRLGAELDIESSLNKGSTFTIIVPSLKENASNTSRDDD